LKREAYQAGSEAGELKIYHRTDLVFGYLYAMPGTRLIFDFVENQGSNQDPVFQLRIDPGSHIFLETGDYRQAYLLLKDADVEYSLDGCFAVQYNESSLQVMVSCYAGSCKYHLTSGGEGEIPFGQQLAFEGAGMAAGGPQAIPVSEARQWVSRLPAGSTAYNCANQFIPTPTPTPRPRPTSTPTEKPRRDRPNPPHPYGGGFTWGDLDGGRKSNSSSIFVSAWGAVVVLVGAMQLAKITRTEMGTSTLVGLWIAFFYERLTSTKKKLSQSAIVSEPGGD
jgi:hypothetical protein